MPPGKLTLFILNPAAGACRRIDAWAVARSLASEGLEVETAPSARPDEPAREARERGFDRVVVAGGDGSLRSVVDATDLPVALLPLGTSNSVARSLGIPLGLAAAIRVAAGDACRRVDVGEVTGPRVRGRRQSFMLCASAGVDAEVARRYELGRSGRSGFLRYTVVAARTARLHRHVPIDVTADGRPVARGVKMVVAANMRVYGGFFTMTPGALFDDGLLDVAMMRADGSAGLAGVLLRAFFGRPQPPGRVVAVRARAVRWQAERDVPFQLDGEPAGYLPVEVSVRPGAVRMFLPPGGRTSASLARPPAASSPQAVEP